MALIAFVSDDLLEDICVVSSLGRQRVSFWSEGRLLTVQYNKDRVPLWSDGQGVLPPIIKELGSLSSEFASYCITQCTYTRYLAVALLSHGM